MLCCSPSCSACPQEIEALLVILGVIGGVLAVGLALLLIWKLLATIQVSRLRHQHHGAWGLSKESQRQMNADTGIWNEGTRPSAQKK